MKFRDRLRPWILGGMLAFALPAMSWSQDSGPGPVPPAEVQAYDVTLVRLFSTLEGTFTFSGGDDGGTAVTTGALEADIDGQLLVGTWTSVDVGDFAIWSAQASGETNTVLAAGLATPEALIGQATFTGGSGFLAFLRNRYLLFGEAVVTEPPVGTAN